MPAPISNGMLSTFTLEMDDESAAGAGPFRHSLNDVTAARLRRYHQQSDRRLHATLQLFRERTERERRSRLRLSRSPLSVAAPGCPGWPLPAAWPPWRRASGSCCARAATSASTASRRGRNAPPPCRQSAPCTARWGRHERALRGLDAHRQGAADAAELALAGRARAASGQEQHGGQALPVLGHRVDGAQAAGPGLLQTQGLLCFKKMDLFKDELGEDMGYVVLHSIDPLADEISPQVSSFDTYAATGATWPPLNQGHQNRTRSASSAGFGSGNFVRGFISLAIVFKSVGEDRVAMFAHGQFNPSGRLPPLLGDSCIAEWLTSIANTVQSGQAKNLSLLLVGQRQTGAGVDHSGSRQRCGVCARSLFFWDTPRNCRGCWKPCCRTCRVTKPIFCAHYHSSNAAAGQTSGPCTETFCLACVCAVIPSGATINARLIKRLAKKRKRAPTFFRPTMTASSITDGSLPQHQQQQATVSERAERLLAAAEMSSISVLSSLESEKHQQHRLSLNARPKKRAFLQSQPEITGQEVEDGEVEDAASTMLEVLEHYQIRRGGTGSVISGYRRRTRGLRCDRSRPRTWRLHRASFSGDTPLETVCSRTTTRASSNDLVFLRRRDSAKRRWSVVDQELSRTRAASGCRTSRSW